MKIIFMKSTFEAKYFPYFAGKFFLKYIHKISGRALKRLCGRGELKTF
jgi:hypothetical protein